ncbi:hypothetical protein PUN28_007266 [Cardiocondyla obscurior]
MVKTSNVLAAFAVVFLAFSSSSSAEHNSDVYNVFNSHELNYEIEPVYREKRQNEAEEYYLRNIDPLTHEKEAELSEAVYEKRAVYAEKAKDQTRQNDEEKSEEREKSNVEVTNDIEEAQDTQDDVFSYKNMHDLIQALILADEEEIIERLKQLRKNDPKSETHSKLPKRQAVASASASASASATSSSDLLGATLWDPVSLVDLDAHSCETEAFSHGHFHLSGTLGHEFFCELRKLWHYVLIIFRNFRSELTLGPLVAGDVVAEGVSDSFFYHVSHIAQAVIREPHHLLVLPDIIRDAVPFPSIFGAFNRVRFVFSKVFHFGLDLLRGHARHVFNHFLNHPHLGVHLQKKLHKLHKLQKYGSILPLEDVIAEPIGVAETSAVAATATATATATASSDSVVIPNYQRSLAELLSSCRGFYDGFHASGFSHLIRAGAQSFSVSSAFSRISSYLPRIPLFSNFFSNYDCAAPQTTTVTASSAASASSVASASSAASASSIGFGGPAAVVAAPVISPVIEPIVETGSASASATATASVAETQPAISVGPTIVPSVVSYEPVSSNVAASAAATATATAAASPVVSGYQTAPLIQAVPTLSPAIVSNTVSETSSVAVSSAAASASPVISTSIYGRVPHTHRKHYKSKPIHVSKHAYKHAPSVTSSAAAASASASTGGRVLLEPARYRGLDLDIDRRFRYPLGRSRIYSAGGPSAAASSAAASVSGGSAASTAAASSSASSSLSDGYSLVLPREQVIGALGYNYLVPGDVVTVTLKNKSVLFCRVVDANSPLTFSFLKPKLRTSLVRSGGRVWNLLPRDFKDPECIRKFDNPLLLSYNY